MPLESKFHFVTWNPRPVIRHPDPTCAASYFDVNLGGTSIKGIFHQLFHHRGWPFDHLPGSDLGDSV
jgi:hypothetical protein